MCQYACRKVTFLCAEELPMLAEAQRAVEAKCTNVMLRRSTCNVTTDIRLLLVLSSKFAPGIPPFPKHTDAPI